MKRFRKVYVEISNICNMRCAFCPGTSRKPQVMGSSKFKMIIEKLRPYTDFLYFHLMGEPLCHPNLGEYLTFAQEMGFKVIITTNGTLLKKQHDLLLNSPALHKVNISLHAFEANEISMPFDEYIENCVDFAANSGEKIVCLRLWNGGGADKLNNRIKEKLLEHFPAPWINEPRGIRIGHKVYLEHGEKFDWPDLNATDLGKNCRCYGLNDQIGILCDGSVVPCCLDHNGDITLGNLLTQEMTEILESPRAKAIMEGFQKSLASEELCRKCGYARRFTR